MPTTVTLNPDAQGFYNNWTLGAGLSKLLAVNDDSDATYILPNSGTYDPGSFDSYTLGNMGVANTSVISSVIVNVRYAANTLCSGRIFGRLNGTDQISSLFGFSSGTDPALANQEETYDLPRPGGGAWSVNDVDNLEVGVFLNWGGTQPGVLKIWVEVTYQPAGVQLETTRDAASKSVSRYGRQPDALELPLAPEFLRLDMTDDLPVFHALIPTASGTGSGTNVWDRFLGRVSALTIDPNNLASPVVATVEDLRDYIHAYRDGGVTPLEPSGLSDGNLILDPGATRTYDGPVTTLESGLSGLIVSVPEDAEPVNFEGRLHQSQGINYVLDSAFGRATTSGTPWGVWAGTTNVSMETTGGAFGQAVSANHLVLVGSTGTVTITHPNTSSPANYNWLSLDHHESTTSGILQFRLFSAANRYWSVAAQGWTSSGVVSNDITNRTSPTRETFYVDATTMASVRLSLVFLPKADLDECHVYHAQYEPSQNGRGWASSRIVTGASSGTCLRAANSLKLSNTTTARVFPATRGTYLFRYMTFWNSSDTSTGGNNMNVLYSADSSTDVHRLFWTVGSSFFTFRRVVGANTYNVNSSGMVLSRGTTGCAAVTWQSTDGEFGDASYTLKITTDGLVASETTSAAFTATSNSTWFRGSIDGTSGHWNGTLWDERMVPYVMTLPEIRRWMQRSS